MLYWRSSEQQKIQTFTILGGFNESRSSKVV
nr:MAG TPA: hypothetical protein [Caudoviricetes sp.]